MVKRAAGALLYLIKIDQESPRSLSTQITVAIRDIILSGGLRTGDRLPATRTLAEDLGVSRTTMVEVFERLVAEGLVESRTGAGTFVSNVFNAKPPLQKPGSDRSGLIQASPHSNRGTRFFTHSGSSPDSVTISPLFGERLPHKARAFTTALPAFDMFPLALWSRQTAKHWRDQRDVVLGYGDATGYPPLRRAIAAHLLTNHGFACEDEQIFIVNGAQQAFHLIASILLDPADKAWFENPGAIGAHNALLAAGADLVPVGIDSEGIVVENGARMAPDFSLALVTPAHQQSLGSG